MLKKNEIPVLKNMLTSISEQQPRPIEQRQHVLLDPPHAEKLAQSLEEQLQPIIKEAIRDAVKDSARRLARDLRHRLNDELGLMIREAVDEAIHTEMKDMRRS